MKNFMQMSGRDIKKLQHKLYTERLRKIEKGESESQLFSPYSCLGKLKSSKIKIVIKI